MATIWEPLEVLAFNCKLPVRWLRDAAESGEIPSLMVAGEFRFNPDAVADALNRTNEYKMGVRRDKINQQACNE